MLTFSIFLRTILVACQTGAMMETRWSFLIVKLKESIGWNYLDTTPCNHILIWMKGVHLSLQSTSDPRIASSRQFFSTNPRMIVTRFFRLLDLDCLGDAKWIVVCIHFIFKQKQFKQFDIVYIYLLTNLCRHSCNLNL